MERLSSRTRALYILVAVLASVAIVLPFLNHTRAQGSPAQSNTKKLRNFDAQIAANANKLLEDGRQTFRFDTFGDQAFWGGALQLHQAIKGAALGGVGPGISPSTALSLGRYWTYFTRHQKIPGNFSSLQTS